jgi:hypothetical protein
LPFLKALRTNKIAVFFYEFVVFAGIAKESYRLGRNITTVGAIEPHFFISRHNLFIQQTALQEKLF